MKIFAPLGFLVCCVSAATDAKDISKTAIAGQTTKMWAYHSWNRQCETGTGVVKVLTQPKHGKVKNRLVNSTVTTDHWGKPVRRCAGARIKAFQVDYTPDRGFRGTDSFTLDVTWHGGQRDVDTFNITVE